MRMSKFHKEGIEYLEFQPKVIEFLAKNKRCVLGLPTGLGKTFASFSLFSYLLEKDESRQMMYICEKSVIKQAQKELNKMFVGIKSSLLYENKRDERIKIYEDFLNGESSVLFLTYDNISVMQKKLTKLENEKSIVRKRPTLKNKSKEEIKASLDDKNRQIEESNSDLKYEIKLILAIAKKCILSVVDEATNFKTYGSVPFEAVSKITYRTSRSIGLTASPVMRWLFDFQYIFMGLQLKPIKMDSFRKNFCIMEIVHSAKADRFGKKPEKPVGFKNVDLYYEKIKPYFYSKNKDEVSGLPPFNISKHNIISCKITKDAIKSLSAKYSSIPYTLEAIAESTPSVILKTTDELKYSAKEKELLHLLEYELFQQKVVIYSPFKQSVLRLEHILKSRFGEDYATSIHGDTVDREENKEEFIKNPDCNIMLITDAAAKGLDGLQVSNELIFYTLPPMGGQFVQIAGRIRRIGSESSHLNVRLFLNESSVDEDLWLLVQNELILMKKSAPDSVDTGLIDESQFSLMEKHKQNLKDPEDWLKTRIQSRRSGDLEL